MRQFPNDTAARAVQFLTTHRCSLTNDEINQINNNLDLLTAEVIEPFVLESVIETVGRRVGGEAVLPDNT